jgi:hypothetical protein
LMECDVPAPYALLHLRHRTWTNPRLCDALNGNFKGVEISASFFSHLI